MTRHRHTMDRLVEFLATGFYSGYLKPGPGTWGSWLALCIYTSLANFLPLEAAHTALILGLLFTAIGIPVATRFEQITQEHDPGYIVIDEFAGLCLTFCAVPFSLTLALTGFLLFRLFDILKPYPLKYLQDLPAGWGVMLDDVGAGLYAAFLLSLLHRFVF